MIDRWIYKFCDFIDRCFEKAEEVLTFDWPNCKKKKNKKDRNEF